MSKDGRWLCKHCGGEIPKGLVHVCPAIPGDCASKHQLEGGTTRSEKALAFHLIPREGIDRVAIRFKLGADVHGEGNWKKSIHLSEKAAANFCIEAWNHMMNHVLNLLPRKDARFQHEMDDPSADKVHTDDDLGAVGWAVCVLAYAEAYWGKPWTELNRQTPEPSPRANPTQG